MAKATDLGSYYRISADTRDLNYDKFFEEGNKEISEGWEYNSHNTERLDIQGIKELLLSLDLIKKNLMAGAYNYENCTGNRCLRIYWT